MGTLACSIELNKQNGITITVLNKDGNITQTVVMNGTSIVTTCQGQQNTSTITQLQDSITIKCKDFSLQAETITCKSTKNTLHQSDQKVDIQSTQDMTLKSSANLSAEAASEAAVKGQSLTASATNAAKVSGMTLSLSGTQKAEMSGAQLSLSGSAQAEMSGAMTKVSASGTMNVEGQLTTVKGSITNIQGSLVKLG